MEFLGSVWDYVIPFLFVLTILVFVHEYGHYYLARRNGVRVEVFSIGFGPEIYGWTDAGGTRWKISAVPLGGYVRMFGEYDLEGGPEEEVPMTEEEMAISFHHKRVGQRSAIVLAGPFANFLFAILVLGILFSTAGSPTPRAGVGEIIDESAAAVAGFQVGDTIVAIDDEKIEWFEDLRRVVSARPEQQLLFVIEREDARLSIQATPAAFTMPDGEVIGRLGVKPDPNQVGYIRHDPLTATWLAVEYSTGLVVQIFSYLGQVITGSRSADELGGPLRIAQISGEMAQGGFINLVFFMAALSVNLGLINLFPIPMLDGGHLVYYVAEAVRGRPLDQRAQEYGFRFGLVLVLLLMIFATWNDLVHLKVFEFIRNFGT